MTAPIVKLPADKAAAITAAILTRIRNGETVSQALDAVLGEGTHRRLADEVWEAANATR